MSRWSQARALGALALPCLLTACGSRDAEVAASAGLVARAIEAVRNALEPLVCREAAVHCKAADAKALRAIITRMQKQSGNPKAFLRLNWDLHRRMAKMAVNAPLQTLYLTLLDFVDDGLENVTSDEFFDADDASTVATIKELLETRIRPAVAGDGGDITFRGFKDGVVYLAMKGSCSGCPSSTATLKHGIQNLLRHFLPDVREVQSV